MTRADDVETFRNLLTAATAWVDDKYFLLPVADQNGGEPIIQYRERVYSYELYHQLRLEWPDWDYSLGGEVDKRRHLRSASSFSSTRSTTGSRSSGSSRTSRQPSAQVAKRFPT